MWFIKMLEVKRWYLNNPLRNYNYLLSNSASKTCLILDPTVKTPYIEQINQNSLKVEAILLTHEHSDHTAAALPLKQQFNAPIYAKFPMVDNTPVDHSVDNHEILYFTTATCQVMATPGHTKNHVCFYFKQNHTLFCGDTLFAAGVGNVHDKSADLEALFNSITQLNQLPQHTKIYPGHDYLENNLLFALSIDPENRNYRRWYQKIQAIAADEKPITTIADEQKINIFMQSNDTKLWTVLAKNNINVSDAKGTFYYLRARKDVF